MRFGRIVVIALVVGTAAGCTSTSSDPKPTPSDTVTVATTPPPSSPTSSPTPTLSANATAAIAAYVKLKSLTHEAERSPRDADYRAIEKVSVVPEQGLIKKEILRYGYDGLAFRGSPPNSRPTMVSESSGARPYPTIVLHDCPTYEPSWRPYYTSTGRPAVLVKPKVPPPFAVTVTVLFIDKHWAVYKTKPDTTRTCTP